ncbi:MAG: hypothetical protein Q4A75_05300, partial [Peptostreptococcaceae bacterium]|nr:hypothetical protein [Peptostreptococcaceae bacterium]
MKGKKMDQKWKKGIRSMTAVILSILLLLPNYAPWLSTADEPETMYSRSEAAAVMQDAEETQDDAPEQKELPFKIEYDHENHEWRPITENKFTVQEGKRFRVFVKYTKESSDELKNSRVGFKIGDREADARWYEGKHISGARAQGSWFKLGLVLQAIKAGEETITVTVPGYDPIEIKVEVEAKKDSGPNPWEIPDDDEELPFEIRYKQGKGEWATYDPDDSIELEQKRKAYIEVEFHDADEEEDVEFSVDGRSVEEDDPYDGDLFDITIKPDNSNQIVLQ